MSVQLCKKCDSTYQLSDSDIEWKEFGTFSMKIIKCKNCGAVSILETIEDNPGSILNSFIDVNLIFKGIKEFNSIDEYCDMLRDNISKVTIDDICKVANTIKLDTIYRLQKEKI